MVIRDAEPRDIEAVIRLMRLALEQSVYNHLELDNRAVRRVAMWCIGSPTQFCKVVDIDGELEGVLMAQVEKIWHSPGKQASDLVFYTTEKARGFGGLLARRFVRWALKQKGVKCIQFSVTHGSQHIKRTGKMLEKIGLTYVGGNYMLNLKES